MNMMETSFGQRLKHLRKLRSYSQLELAERCGVSQRHVAFLELGKSRPSRRMVLDLAETLRLPIDMQNSLLLSAGFAAVYPSTPWQDSQLAFVHQAISLMLEKQEPYPAIVVDRLWNIQRSNVAAKKMFAWIFNTSLPEPDTLLHTDVLAGQNLMRLMCSEALRPILPNALILARELLAVTRRMLDASIEALAELDALEAACGLSTTQQQQLPPQWPVVPVVLKKENVTLSLISSITTLGTPRDLNVQNTLIESFFPADAITRDFFDQL